MKLKNGLTAGLIIASFIFAVSICAAFLGYRLVESTVHKSKEIGLIVFLTSFLCSGLSIGFIVKCKIKIDILIEYGNPVFTAAEQIKEVVHSVNVYGIDQLKNIIEEISKTQIIKSIQDGNLTKKK